MGMNTVIETARRALEAELDATAAAMQTFPRLPSGLTPDAVKASPAWKSARAAFDRAFAALRTFNGRYKPGPRPRRAVGGAR